MAYEYQEYPKYLYHHKLAPEGKIFQSEETKGLKRKGWVDTPAKFPKPSRFSRMLTDNVKPWWAHWEWAVKAAAVLLGLVAAIIGLVKALRWHH